MVRVTFLVEKMITLAGFSSYFSRYSLVIFLFFSLIWLSFLLIFSAFFHNEGTFCIELSVYFKIHFRVFGHHPFKG